MPDAALHLKAALAGYDAQYGRRALGEQHDLPEGCVARVEAVVSRACDALAQLERANGVLAAAGLHYPHIGVIKDYNAAIASDKKQEPPA